MEISRDTLRRALASQRGEPPHLTGEAVLAYLNGGREEALETHLGACISCRKALVELSELAGARAPAPASSWAWRWAAASVLLFLGGLAWRWREAREPSPLPSAPYPGTAAFLPSALPVAGGEWAAEQTDATGTIGEASSLCLRKGGRLRMIRTSPPSLRLASGSLWVETEGEALTLEAGDLSISLSRGALVAEVLDPSPARGAWLMREALAGNPVPEVRVRVLEGEATLLSDGGNAARVLASGLSLARRGGAWVEGQGPSWPGPWHPLGQGVLTLKDSGKVLLEDPPASGYVFDALVRKRRPSAELGALFEAGGRGWEVPVGSGLLPAREGWTRLRIAVGGGRAKVSMEGREVLALPVDALDRKVRPRSERGVGVRAWGGNLEVCGARWRPAIERKGPP
jgi:hypothetical protein